MGHQCLALAAPQNRAEGQVPVSSSNDVTAVNPSLWPRTQPPRAWLLWSGAQDPSECVWGLSSESVLLLTGWWHVSPVAPSWAGNKEWGLWGGAGNGTLFPVPGHQEGRKEAEQEAGPRSLSTCAGLGRWLTLQSLVQSSVL